MSKYETKELKEINDLFKSLNVDERNVFIDVSNIKVNYHRRIQGFKYCWEDVTKPFDEFMQDTLSKVFDKTESEKLQINTIPQEEIDTFLNHKSRKIYENKIENTVLELVQNIDNPQDTGVLTVSFEPNKPPIYTSPFENSLRVVTLSQYIQTQLSFKASEEVDLKPYYEKMIKLFNYLVEKNIIDYGVFIPLTTMNLSSTAEPVEISDNIERIVHQNEKGEWKYSAYYFENIHLNTIMKPQEHLEAYSKLKDKILSPDEVYKHIMFMIYVFPKIDLIPIDIKDPVQWLNEKVGFNIFYHEGCLPDNFDVWNHIDNLILAQ